MSTFRFPINQIMIHKQKIHNTLDNILIEIFFYSLYTYITRRTVGKVKTVKLNIQSHSQLQWCQLFEAHRCLLFQAQTALCANRKPKPECKKMCYYY